LEDEYDAIIAEVDIEAVTQTALGHSTTQETEFQTGSQNPNLSGYPSKRYPASEHPLRVPISQPVSMTGSQAMASQEQHKCRKNVVYEVLKKKEVKSILESIYVFITEKYPNQSGLIYCISVQECEELTNRLTLIGVSAKAYHQTILPVEKHNRQLAWQKNEIQVLVATSAFSCKSNTLRFVIYNSIPNSMHWLLHENHQPGADGNPAHCVIFYKHSDTWRWELQNGTDM
jgi:superfamily II DNA helicase RecQ